MMINPVQGAERSTPTDKGSGSTPNSGFDSRDGGQPLFSTEWERIEYEKEQAAKRLRTAIERVIWFDWSGNDPDAAAAIDELRAAFGSRR